MVMEFSISPGHVDHLIACFVNQEEHHKTESFQASIFGCWQNTDWNGTSVMCGTDATPVGVGRTRRPNPRVRCATPGCERERLWRNETDRGRRDATVPLSAATCFAKKYRNSRNLVPPIISHSASSQIRRKPG